VLNLVHGGGDVGAAMVDHPATRAVSFTGSNQVGGDVYVRAAHRGIRAQCEMGGKNPVIVMEDADLDLAVAGTVQGAFGSTGQRCTATSRAIVIESVADAFLEKLLPLAKAMRVGNGTLPATQMGPIVTEAQLARVLEYVDIGRAEGAELLCGGERLSAGDLERGYFLGATVFDQVRPEMRLAREEIFGPVLSVIRVRSLDEALEVANSVEFGLTSSIYTADIGRMFRYIDDTATGMLHVNSPTLGGEAQMPFGGTGSTAVGPFEQGTEVFDFYTETRAVYVDYTGSRREGKLY
jgi:aldehyde dehydrogenase (NAD+)